jgi:DNA-binding NtrC family response regulator
MADLPGLLLIDDDPLISGSLRLNLRDSFSIQVAATREEAGRLLQKLRTEDKMPYLALVDLGLPPNPHEPDEGFAMVRDLLTFNRFMKILVLSGQDSLDNTKHALTLGAVDFIAKPANMDLLKARLNHQRLILEAEQHKPALPPAVSGDCGIIGESPAIASLRIQIRQFADSPFAVMIEGESGSGKELVAQSLHTQSRRAAAPCLTINCAAFAGELLDAQLFGHAKGAYTGAAQARNGFFEEADEGSLILDEIGEMPMELQAKLLRVLENGEYYRLGETKARKTTARIIAASNRDLREEVRNGRFRSDLYHRLTVLTIKVPPLAERGHDRLLLLQYFQAFYASMGANFKLDSAATARWLTYSFPGNVRELRNIVIRLGAKYPDNENITLDLLENEMERDPRRGAPETPEDSDEAVIRQLNQGDFCLDAMLLEWERRYINAALKISKDNLSQAARLLGINRTTLYSKMDRLKKEEP